MNEPRRDGLASPRHDHGELSERQTLPLRARASTPALGSGDGHAVPQLQAKRVCVATTRRQAGYLTVFLAAIAILPAGLVALWSYPIAGVILILAALALATQSCVELYRIRRLKSLGDT